MVLTMMHHIPASAVEVGYLEMLPAETAQTITVRENEEGLFHL